MFPLHESGMVSGLVCGVLFGFVLENAGFGSPAKLIGQFRLNDWSVFKVMFTAIVVAAVGLWGMRVVGLIAPDTLFVPQALVMASAVGGALIGAGFAIGGYCPGTSMVGMSSGRIDALVFVVGLFIGTTAFAGFYGDAMRSMMAVGEMIDGDTFADVYGIADPIMLGIMTACLVGIFYLGSWFERRGPGPVTAEQAVAGAE
ncbi:MAG: YeeE/YedE thiosulfate transporter family protein [Rhodoferax sp.]|nr:YeeE/YedE thiosulfate transporter family protein [Rhodoferax sp.]